MSFYRSTFKPKNILTIFYTFCLCIDVFIVFDDAWFLSMLNGHMFEI